jgi:CRP/FNR family transcriptional regulator, cyclic AMP receptor protein
VPRGDALLMAGAPVDAVRQVPLFAELSRREAEQVARLFKERRFAAGETVAREGSGGAAFYLIESGEAVVSVGGEQRRTLGPGDCFGEIALIDEGARSATITAVTDLRCHGLTFWDFRPLVQGSAEISWKLLHSVVRKLRDEQAARP